MDKKDAGRQVVSAYDIAFESGKEKGKQGVLVNVGALEVLFNTRATTFRFYRKTV